jgi:hypothetical protein
MAISSYYIIISRLAQVPGEVRDLPTPLVFPITSGALRSQHRAAAVQRWASDLYCQICA